MSDHPLNILKWLQEAGDDIELSENPIDRFLESAEAKEKAKAQSATRSSNTRADIASRAKAVANRTKSNDLGRANRGVMDATLPSEEVIEQARALAKSASNPTELKAALETFEGCNLSKGAKNIVFSDGNENADLMIVGKAPERDEDLQGIPFSGEPGLMLDKMLAAIGQSRESVYLINIVPWHTPGGRPPTVPECEICRPFIERHIELIDPKIIVMMGNSPARTLLDKKDHVTRIRGQWEKAKIGSIEADAICTLHPSYLIKQPAQKKLAWQDLLKIKAKLEEVGD